MGSLTCSFIGHKGPALCAWHPGDAQLWRHNASVAGSVHRLGAGVDAAGLGEGTVTSLVLWHGATVITSCSVVGKSWYR